MLKLIHPLPLTNILDLYSRTNPFLMLQFILQLQILSLDFSLPILELMIIYLIFDQLLFLLLNLFVCLFESIVLLTTLLTQFRKFLPLRIELPRQLHYSLLLESLFLHLLQLSIQLIIHKINLNIFILLMDFVCILIYQYLIISMSALAKLSKLLPPPLHFQVNAVPTILIEGQITAQTTLHVHNMLQKIPKNKNKIAILVNSQGGCMAQTHIILNKINLLAKRNQAQVWTFGQQWALNAGFLLLSSGHKVFVDSSTVIGGLEVGQTKLLRGKLGDYISTITYKNQPSYLSEVNSSSEFDSGKKKEVTDVYSRISEQVRQDILRLRGNKVSQNTNLNNFYIGGEAVKYGLADTVDRVHLALGRQSIQKDAVLLDKNNFQKWFDRIRKLNISD